MPENQNIKTPKITSSDLTVIDFFCGAGGFSEGFRQAGFDIVSGIDHWQPAIDTFNHNFGKSLKTKNILDFWDSLEDIESLPNTDVIIGSPPCVSFSNSNKSGKADKSLGVRLTECFLRVVAVKKHQPNSILKAWYMENVANSRRYLQPTYTFHDLKLSDWAKKNRISPQKIAINLLENSEVVNSAEYGSVQVRKRVISGEIISLGRLALPSKINQSPKGTEGLPYFKPLRVVIDNLPNPFEPKSNKSIKDPLYDIEIPQDQLTDHFYDTGVYECEWKSSKYWKTNHPYMGLMSFPESLDKPSRTITATKIATSREAILYKSEYERIGNGEFRSPTVRETASIMGFPITYQFCGSENSKLRLVGNAVCPAVSRGIALKISQTLNIQVEFKPLIVKEPNLEGIFNLNTYSIKSFENPPIKKQGAKFRRHPFKGENMTVAMMNHDIDGKQDKKTPWKSIVFHGTGEGFVSKEFPIGVYKELEPIIEKNFSDGTRFIKIMNNGFSEKIAGKRLMQKMYEIQKSQDNLLEPSLLIEELGRIIQTFNIQNEWFDDSEFLLFGKPKVPKKHLYALYGINKIITEANLK